MAEVLIYSLKLQKIFLLLCVYLAVYS